METLSRLTFLSASIAAAIGFSIVINSQIEDITAITEMLKAANQTKVANQVRLHELRSQKKQLERSLEEIDQAVSNNGVLVNRLAREMEAREAVRLQMGSQLKAKHLRLYEAIVIRYSSYIDSLQLTASNRDAVLTLLLKRQLRENDIKEVLPSSKINPLLTVNLRVDTEKKSLADLRTILSGDQLQSLGEFEELGAVRSATEWLNDLAYFPEEGLTASQSRRLERIIASQPKKDLNANSRITNEVIQRASEFLTPNQIKHLKGLQEIGKAGDIMMEINQRIKNQK